MDFNSLMAAADDVLISTFNAKGGVILWPGESREVQIEAVFDDPFARTDIPDGGKIQGSDPSFTVRDGDIIGLKKNDAVLISGQKWYVKEPQPDGSGVTCVFLSKYQKSPFDKPGSRL